jgi:4,4'-diaponeurosporenoate glycosyltransferase
VTTTWVIAAGWLTGWVLLWRLPRLGPLGDPAPLAPGRRVSVIVPARNEVDRLPDLLACLGRQTRPADQVVVVDDDSSDGTAEAARAVPGVDVVATGPLPAGWTGKAWACATGVAAAQGDVLVFLDADVGLADDALGSLLATRSAHGGLVSVQPHHHVRRPVEVLSLPFNVVAMMGLGTGSLLPPRREWGAAGPCLATARDDYEAVGGHAAVRGAVAEDLALAARYRAAGLGVRCLAGGDRVRFRMYRDLRRLVQGWSKNLAAGVGRTPLVRTVGIALWVTALLSMVLRLVEGPGSTATAAATFGAVYVAGAGQMTVLGRQVGRFGPAGLAWPVLIVFFVAVFTLSVVRTLVLRRVRWSGRTVTLAGGQRS